MPTPPAIAERCPRVGRGALSATRVVTLAGALIAAAGMADAVGDDDRGGEPGGWWAARPLGDPVAPRVVDAGWPRGGIDRFVLARLEAAGLRPSVDAEPRVLARRIHYDLTGLPPEPEAVEQFVRDPSDAAFERLVDRLLASPAFGERWGRHWLDLARYADSNGGDINFTYPNAWRYRNWVIDAVNADMPFAQFVREQVAGDLLPWTLPEKRAGRLAATGFLMVATKMTSERDKEKMMLDIADEHVDTVGQVFLGLTLGCARCHEHKSDPVTAEDYHALAGIFTSTHITEGIRMNNPVVSGWLERELPMAPEQAAAAAEARDRLEAAEASLAAAKKQVKLLESRPALAAGEGFGTLIDDVDAVRVGAWKESKHSPGYVGSGYLHDDQSGKGEKSITYRWLPRRTGLHEVRVSFTAGGNRARAVPVAVAHRAGQARVAVDQTIPPPLPGGFVSLGWFPLEAGVVAEVTIGTAGTEGAHVIADAVHALPVEDLPAEAFFFAGGGGSGPGPELAAAQGEAKRLEEEIEGLRKVVDSVPRVMAPRDRDEVGDLAVRVRGEPRVRGEVVPRGFPVALPGGGPARIAEGESGRRELAEWLVAPDNPLTWRVAANRAWHHLFGAGIVRTVDNFGTLGDAPSHPELLDHLARRFLEHGGSMKALVREIVLSRTYRQSVGVNPTAAELDPDNRLLWRQNRRRLEAEAIRDSLLGVSGELERGRPEGSPVAGFAESALGSDGKRGSDLDVGALRCRSVYLPMVRDDMPPTLAVFDMADPGMVVGRRPVTNVPAQALFFLNSGFVRERSEAAARRVEAVPEAGGRVDALFEIILCRPTRDASERERAMAFAESRGLPALARVLLASAEFRFVE